MGTNYKEDRDFTDFIHKKIAISKIYDVLGWSEYDVGEVESVRADMFEGIDYHFRDEEGNIITTQERKIPPIITLDSVEVVFTVV